MLPLLVLLFTLLVLLPPQGLPECGNCVEGKFWLNPKEILLLLCLQGDCITLILGFDLFGVVAVSELSLSLSSKTLIWKFLSSFLSFVIFSKNSL